MTYTCALCGIVAESPPGKEDALAELMRGEVARGETIILCEDCYHSVAAAESN
jgi:hypothetical protein